MHHVIKFKNPSKLKKKKFEPILGPPKVWGPRPRSSHLIGKLGPDSNI